MTKMRGSWKGKLRLGLACAALCSATSAWATEPARAELLIDEANRLRAQGLDQKAVPLLKEAYDLAPTPRTAGQLGLGELGAGYFLEADRHLDEAFAAPRHPWVNKNRAALETAKKMARSHLVTLAIDGSPADAEIVANRQPVGRLPQQALVLAEGRLNIVVRAPGYQEESQQITLSGGGQASLTFNLKRVPSQPAVENVASQEHPATATLREEEESSGRALAGKVVPGALGVAAIGALGVGIWQHIAWRGAVSSFDAVSGCYAELPNRGTDSRCAGLYDQIGRHRSATFVGYGAAGLLAVGAGLSYWLMAPSPEKRTTGATSSQSEPKVHWNVATNLATWVFSMQGVF